MDYFAPSNIFTLFFILAFLVPGFIWDYTISFFIPQSIKEERKTFIRYIALSSLNIALCSWLIYLLLSNDFFRKDTLNSALAWLFILLINPVVCGSIIGLLSKKGLIRNVLQKFGLGILHYCPTAWDYKFSNIEDSEWVIVTLNNGTTIYGLYGSKSFSSAEPEERDLYLQEIYTISEGGEWIKDKKSDGILLKGNQISHIEFYYD